MNRSTARYPLRDVSATLERTDPGEGVPDDARRAYAVVDVSRNGCYVRDAKPGDIRWVRFIKRGGFVFKRECKVVDTPTSRGVALRFTSAQKLSDDELRKLGVVLGTEESEKARMRLAVAREDHQSICADIDAIQKCRSRIFIATLGSLSVTSFTVWGYHIQNQLQAGTLCIAMLGIFAVFSAGLLTIAGKGQAINSRRGFLAALAPYLSGEKELAKYSGWSRLQHCIAECGGLRRAGRCGLKIGHDVPISCRDEGEAIAARISSYRKLIPAALNSFTSVSAILFSIAYFAFLLLFGIAFSKAWHEAWPRVDEFDLLTRFLVGSLASALFYRYFKIVGPLVFIAAIFFGVALDERTWDMLGVAGAGALLGSLGWFLTQQLYALRLGKYSFETNAYSWAFVLERCDPFPDGNALAGSPVAGDTASPVVRACALARESWLRVVGERTHEKVVEEFERARQRHGNTEQPS